MITLLIIIIAVSVTTKFMWWFMRPAVRVLKRCIQEVGWRETFRRLMP